MSRFHSYALIFIMIVSILGLVTACETAPPVQEMSDARQAIAVAREAAPADHAAQELETAETYLQSAEQNLTQRNYSRARDDALEAKARALRSLELSGSTKLPPQY